MTKQEIAAKIEELQNQINELSEAVKRVKNTCFSRVEEGDPYCIIDSVGHIRLDSENGSNINQIFYDVANYCTDQDLMKKRAAEEILSRLIWREAEIANADKTIKDNQARYMISYYDKDKSVMPWIVDATLVGSAGFLHIDDARSCIKNVVIPFVKKHPELGWELEGEEEKQNDGKRFARYA